MDHKNPFENIRESTLHICLGRLFRDTELYILPGKDVRPPRRTISGRTPDGQSIFLVHLSVVPSYSRCRDRRVKKICSWHGLSKRSRSINLKTVSV